MTKLLNLSEKENLEKKINLTLKCRREMIKLAFECPLSIKNFLINFQNYDESIFADFIAKINNDDHLCNFVKNAETLVQSRIFYTGANYREIFYSIFDCGEIYKKIASKLAKNNSYNCLEYLYICLNYIDNNLPIKRKRELSEGELNFVEFLLNEGRIEDYMEENDISGETIANAAKNVCENYNCDNINTALNFILIEDWLQEFRKTE